MNLALSNDCSLAGDGCGDHNSVAALDAGVHANVERAVVVRAGVAHGGLVHNVRLTLHDGDCDLWLGVVVPVFLVEVSGSHSSGSLREGEVSCEGSCGGVEFHGVQDTLGNWHVRSGEGLDLIVLQGAILVPEAF